MNRLSTNLLLVLLFFCSALSVKSQVYFLNENFSTATGMTPPSGWTNNTLTGNSSFDKWQFSNPGGRAINSPMSSPAAIFDSDNLSNNSQAEDATLESPSFNTTGYAGVTLKWDQYFQSGFGGVAIVEVWDGSTWTQVYFNNNTTTSNPNTQTLNITSIAANKSGVKVRFRWQGNFSWWWIVDNVQVYYVVDVQPLAILSPAAICGNSYDSITVQLKNNSGFPVSNVPVQVDLSGSLFSGTQNKTYTGSIPANGTATLSFNGGNTLNGGNVTVKATTSLAGDNNSTNDVLNYSITIVGTPAAPTVTNGARCGLGSVTLKANPAVSTDSIAWYASSSGGSPVGLGKTFNTPSIPSTTTFYASSVRGSVGAPNSLTTTTAAGNGQQGAMWDVTPKKDIVLDSISGFWSTTGSYVIRVYYKTGTFIGSQLNSGAWTQLGPDYNVNVTSGGGLTKFDVSNLNLTNGVTYGMYITIISGVSTTLNYTTLSSFQTYSNADMDIYAGEGISGLFGGTFSPRAWNGALHYSLRGCASNRVPVVATVNPPASGAGYTAKSGSKGFFNSGNFADPDVNAAPDKIQYDFVEPNGFLNKDYGSTGTWYFSSVVVKTTGGYTVPTSMYSITNPGNSGRGSFSLNADTTLNDSIVKISVTVIRNDNGCDTTIDRYVYIAPRPHANFSFPIVCRGDKTAFNNFSTIQAGTISYQWNFNGPAGTSTDATPEVVLGPAGTYNVKLVVTSNKGYKDSVTKAVNVFEIPKADFDFTNACEKTAIKLNDKSTLPTGTPSYNWDYGDGSANGNTPNVSKLYTNPGIYIVTFTVDVNGCKNTKSRYVTQMPRATPAFSYSPLTCDNKDVVFTNSSTAPAFGTAGYSWNFGDGNTSNTVNATHTYSSFKSYNVSLISNTDLGCVDTNTQSITLKESPIVSFGISGSACHGDSLKFTNNTTTPVGAGANNYSWDFGDANASSDANPTHQYAGPGSKTVTLVAVSTNNCTSTKDTVINVNLKPQAGFNVNDVCEGDSTNFMDNSTIGDNSSLTYNWNLADAGTSTNTNPTVKYAAPGAKTVSLTVTSGNGCADTKTMVTNVNPKPVAGILIASKLSHDGSFAFTTNTVGAEYVWLFGDGGSDSVKSTSYRYITDGVYTVQLIVRSDKGCVGYATQSIRVNTVGIHGADGIEGAVNMYPNPGSGKFALEFDGIETKNIVSITVVNNLGQKVATVNTATIENSKVNIDLGGQAAGIYFVNVETISGKASFKYNLVK